MSFKNNSKIFKIKLVCFTARYYLHIMKTKKEEKREETISVKVKKSEKDAGRVKAAKEGKTLSSKMAELLFDYISR